MFSKFTAAALADAEAAPSLPFSGAKQKVSIGSLDDPQLSVVAQYNPKELELQRAVAWSESTTIAGEDREEKMHLEHTGTPARSTSLELTFDCYEQPTDWRRRIGVHLDTLDKLATPRDPTSRDEQRRRPHHCVVSWGGALPRFTCVIESLSIKTVVFASNGAPLRATAIVKLKEAHWVAKQPKERGGGKPAPTR